MNTIPKTLRRAIGSIPVVGPFLKRTYTWIVQKRAFCDSESYWMNRYEQGGTSGFGSYGKLAQQKADVINRFVHENAIRSVIEYGCGDGNQLQLADYERYLGFDISPATIERCRQLFAADPTKTFRLTREYDGETADLTLSLDVIFHLVEDNIYNDYMHRLFASSTHYVLIYSSNTNTQAAMQPSHVKHRRFTDWVLVHAPEWELIRHIPNQYPDIGDPTQGSFADFYIYAKRHEEQAG